MCNGHAQQCEASNPTTPDKLLCRCEHNTCGDQCETCCDGFVQKKWRQSRANQEFECERKALTLHIISFHISLDCCQLIQFKKTACQCYGHSTNCTYDSEVDRLNQSIDIYGNYEGGGVCHDCEVIIYIFSNLHQQKR